MNTFEIYSKSACPFCVRARKLITDKGDSFLNYDIQDDYDKRRELLDKLSVAAPEARTVPQIFLEKGDIYIGGYDDLVEWYENNDMVLPGPATD